MSGFKVGDVCVIVSQIDGGESFVGLECTVIEGPVSGRPINHDADIAGYIVDVHGKKSSVRSGFWTVRTQDLRLKRPPSDSTPRDEFIPADPAAWEFVGWRPNKVLEPEKQ